MGVNWQCGSGWAVGGFFAAKALGTRTQRHIGNKCIADTCGRAQPTTPTITSKNILHRPVSFFIIIYPLNSHKSININRPQSLIKVLLSW